MPDDPGLDMAELTDSLRTALGIEASSFACLRSHDLADARLTGRSGIPPVEVPWKEASPRTIEVPARDALDANGGAYLSSIPPASASPRLWPKLTHDAFRHFATRPPVRRLFVESG